MLLHQPFSPFQHLFVGSKSGKNIRFPWKQINFFSTTFFVTEERFYSDLCESAKNRDFSTFPTICQFDDFSPDTQISHFFWKFYSLIHKDSQVWKYGFSFGCQCFSIDLFHHKFMEVDFSRLLFLSI